MALTATALSRCCRAARAGASRIAEVHIEAEAGGELLMLVAMNPGATEVTEIAEVRGR